MRVALQNQRNDLLAFAGVLDDELAAIARTAAVPDYLVRETCLLHRKPDTSGAFWQGWNRLYAIMGHKFYGIWTAVSQAMGSTPRSSSLVENLNSRLRNCLALRRPLNSGRAWLGLLQFFSIIAAPTITAKKMEVPLHMRVDSARLCNEKDTRFKPRHSGPEQSPGPERAGVSGVDPDHQDSQGNRLDRGLALRPHLHGRAAQDLDPVGRRGAERRRHDVVQPVPVL